MLAVNYTNLRDNMKMYMDKVTDDYETMIVTRKISRMLLCYRKNLTIISWRIFMLWGIKIIMTG